MSSGLDFNFYNESGGRKYFHEEILYAAAVIYMTLQDCSESLQELCIKVGEKILLSQDSRDTYSSVADGETSQQK